MEKLPAYMADLQQYENRVQPNVMTIGFKLYEEIVQAHDEKLKWQNDQIVKLNKIIAEWETKPPSKLPISTPPQPPQPSTPAPVNPPLPADSESIVSTKKIKRTK